MWYVRYLLEVLPLRRLFVPRVDDDYFRSHMKDKYMLADSLEQCSDLPKEVGSEET